MKLDFKNTCETFKVMCTLSIKFAEILGVSKDIEKHWKRKLRMATLQ